MIQVLRSSSCPICGNSKLEEFLALDESRLKRFLAYSNDFYLGLFERWLPNLEVVLMKCGSCTHIFYQSTPSEIQLTLMYESVIRKDKSLDPRRPPSRNMVGRMKSFRKLFPKARAATMIDFGAGYGRWAQAGVAAGFAVTAYEPHETRSGNEGNVFWTHDYESIKDRKYDFIFLEQVLEHTINPLGVLGKIKTLMHENSVMRLSVPNISKLELDGDLWGQWPYDGNTHHPMAPFQHIHGFTSQSIDALCNRTGYAEYYLPRVFLVEPSHYARRLGGRYIAALSTTTRYLQMPSD